MKFLCLICAEKVMEQMPEADARKHYQDYRDFTDAITRSGHYLGCNRLLPAQTATTVRVRNGKITTTDGPFAETKEQLGGFFLVEAANLDDAVAMAAKIPNAADGSIAKLGSPGIGSPRFLIRPCGKSLGDPGSPGGVC